MGKVDEIIDKYILDEALTKIQQLQKKIKAKKKEYEAHGNIPHGGGHPHGEDRTGAGNAAYNTATSPIISDIVRLEKELEKVRADRKKELAKKKK